MDYASIPSVSSASDSNHSWYPHNPHSSTQESSESISESTSHITAPSSSNKNSKVEVYSAPHPIWSNKTSNLKYISQSYWPPSIRKETKESVRRQRISGVEVRDLPPGHFLHGMGQQGLFATTKFWQFDVLGEYVGKIVGDDVHGHYVAALEDKSHSESLGIDAETMGNEMRFINSYLNIAFYPNVTMRTSYINTYPHIVLVCTRDIEAGEEFLLDYGEAYNKAYLIPREPVQETPRVDMVGILPGCGEISSDDEAVAGGTC